MLTNRIYYRFKPYLPWRLRMGVRRILARQQRRQHALTWPINPAAGLTPAGWPGWPEGKKFALVLTHDVEGPSGLAKCQQLMQLEQSLGFRSSFNFIPEGKYKVTPELRAELRQNGFEVGVHDLRHDGKLYWRRSEFAENAHSINGYLNEWGARGFRSGFMLHNRECLHELDIEYDASTFDTDPFEPQPDGVQTIFPFWVTRPSGGGYVELPYTLPQDSTMFLVLRETSSDIWKKKLDWIVQRGGMALVNTHPDYLDFGGSKRQASEYPVAFYAEFLQHIAKTYGADYWQALPREVASWYRKTCVEANPRTQSAALNFESPTETIRKTSLKGKRAAVVLYSYFATDPRPRREAESLHRAGMSVDVFCLRPNSQTPWRQQINGVNVFHMPLRRRRAAKLVYMAQYGWFLTCSFFSVSVLNFKRRYDLVHVHNMPDFLVFSALVPKLCGARVILDLHDPMPELFRSIYGLPAEHYVVRWLKKMEQRSIGFAHLVLTPNRAFQELFTSRSCLPGKIQTVMNSPETTIFDPKRHAPSAPGTGPMRPFILMYHGLLVERHGLDLAIRAVAKLRTEIPGIQLHMYGETTDYVTKIHELIRELGLEGIVQAHGFKPLDEIAKDISQIDLGLIPNRSSSFTQINFPTRIFEYLAMHKPVIVPNTKGIQDYFEEADMLFFEAGNAEDLATKIKWAFQHPQELAQRLARGRAIYIEHNWNAEEKRFVNLVANLVDRKLTAPTA